MTKNTLYVVCPANFEYNDQTYDYRGVEPPLKAFTRQKDAKEYALKLSLEYMRKHSDTVFLHGDDIEYVFTPDGIKLLREYELFSDGDNIYNLYDQSIDHLTDVQLLALLNELHQPLYQVYEVETDPNMYYCPALDIKS